MIEDTASLPGYSIFRHEEGDQAPDLSRQAVTHPLDPLSIDEVRVAAKLIREHGNVGAIKFNCLTLREPTKSEYAHFRAGQGPRPDRRAFAIILAERSSSKVAEVIVNLAKGKCWYSYHRDGSNRG